MNYDFFNDHKIVPVVVLNKLEDTLPTLAAMEKGGIKVAEITFRTACAAEAIKLACEKCPGMLVGAGTVINSKQCEAAIAAGAKFIVSPGFDNGVFDVCVKNDVPYIPGVVTPTEIMNAVNKGLTILKFFPAGVFGGLKALKAMSAAFPGIRFLPTGGVDETNAPEFLAQKFIVGVGGSWMMKGTPEDIENACRRAAQLVK